MGKEEARATIKGKLELEDLDRAKLLYTMRLFKEAVEKAHHLIKEELPKEEIVKNLYWTIPNTHYCESAYTKASGVKLRGNPAPRSLGDDDMGGLRYTYVYLSPLMFEPTRAGLSVPWLSRVHALPPQTVS